MGSLLTQSLGLACLVIGLIIYGVQPERHPPKSAPVPAIYFAIDSSASMMVQDMAPNRLAVAKQQARSLAEQLSNYRLGIIQFAGDARITCPLTQDSASIMHRIDTIAPLYNWPGSRLSDAVLAAYRGFLNQSQNPILVIWSDGDTTSGDVYRMLFYAKQLNMRIISIGMGTIDGDPIPKLSGGFEKENDQIVLSKLNRETLFGIAEQTNGYYFEAGKTTDVSQTVYNQIMQMRQPVNLANAPLSAMPMMLIGVALLLIPLLYKRPWLLALIMLHGVVCASAPSHWYNYAAKTAWRHNNTSLAIQYTQAVVYTPETTPDWLWFNRGKLFQAYGEYDKALQAFVQCNNFYEQAVSLYMTGKFTAAMRLLKPYIIQNPGHYSARILFEHAYRKDTKVQKHPPELIGVHANNHPSTGPMPLPFDTWSQIEILDNTYYQKYNQVPTQSRIVTGRSW
ncbi:MAG: VWA domain-containing protein [Candidatus Marinamargulisbacteria bacterium]|nr:VWA domain-containing protein [Candidatus Marinamargulisbacteria bacterium]